MRIWPRLSWIAVVLLAAGCAQLEPRPELPPDRASPPEMATELDRLSAPQEAAHPGQSAFRLLTEGPEAFVVRARSAQLAGRSIDVQTYIWHADLTGGFLAGTLLQAADRGVRVRLLVDDMDARGKNYGFAALDAHPNIDVRMFNPFSSRQGKAALAFEAMGSFSRINRRMHNKSWIVDNRIAIVGGRNLGDEYFGASAEGNFVDLDFALAGPVVRDVSASFDAYWNSPLAYPMSFLAPQDVSEAALDELRGRVESWMQEAQASRYAEELGRSDSVQRLIHGDRPMVWSADYFFVSDDPRKAQGVFEEGKGSAVLAALLPAMQGSRSQLTVISPYFVPGEQGTALLTGIAQAGSEVNVLTNSLAANDVAAVHGGYSRSRAALLAGGVSLWEFKPVPGSKDKSSLTGSSGASLHTKAMVIDRERLFVGSYNLDPRSTSLNCEQGVQVGSEVLAGELEEVFSTQVSGDRAWAVALEGKELRWRDGAREESRDPDASFGRRFQAWLAKVLHIDAQL
jgi:putative cardiolipin synthase